MKLSIPDLSHSLVMTRLEYGYISESRYIDSLCRDRADAQSMQYSSKQKPYNFSTNTLKAYLTSELAHRKRLPSEQVSDLTYTPTSIHIEEGRKRREEVLKVENKSCWSTVLTLQTDWLLSFVLWHVTVFNTPYAE